MCGRPWRRMGSMARAGGAIARAAAEAAAEAVRKWRRCIVESPKDAVQQGGFRTPILTDPTESEFYLTLWSKILRMQHLLHHLIGRRGVRFGLHGPAGPALC